MGPKRRITIFLLCVQRPCYVSPRCFKKKNTKNKKARGISCIYWPHLHTKQFRWKITCAYAVTILCYSRGMGAYKNRTMYFDLSPLQGTATLIPSIWNVRDKKPTGSEWDKIRYIRLEIVWIQDHTNGSVSCIIVLILSFFFWPFFPQGLESTLYTIVGLSSEGNPTS